MQSQADLLAKNKQDFHPLHNVLWICLLNAFLPVSFNVLIPCIQRWWNSSAFLFMERSSRSLSFSCAVQCWFRFKNPVRLTHQLVRPSKFLKCIPPAFLKFCFQKSILIPYIQWRFYSAALLLQEWACPSLPVSRGVQSRRHCNEQVPTLFAYLRKLKSLAVLQFWWHSRQRRHYSTQE